MLTGFAFFCKDTDAVLDDVKIMGTHEILYAERNPLFQIENIIFTVILLAVKRRKPKINKNKIKNKQKKMPQF